VKEIIERFGADNKGVKRLMKQLDAKARDGKVLLSELILTEEATFYDITDWTDRIVWFEYDSDPVALVQKPHGMDFINWVVVEESNPILKGVVDANLWENLNIIQSLRNWLVVRAAAHPAYASTTPSGEGVDVDYDDPLATLNLRTGEQITPMTPRQLDPHISEILAEMSQGISASTVARSLSTLEFSGNMPFSTVNAILTAAVSSLGVQSRLSGIAIAKGLRQSLQWITYSKKDSSAYVTKDMMRKTLTPGATVRMLGEPLKDLDIKNALYINEPNSLHIEVTMRPNTATDRQQRVNMAAAMRQLKYPSTYLHELLDDDTPEFNIKQFNKELILDAVYQAEAQKILGAAQLEIQQQAMMLQQQIQQEAAAAQQQMTQQGSPQGAYPGGPGFSAEGGGQTPYMANPQNREGVTGQDYTGEGIVGP